MPDISSQQATFLMSAVTGAIRGRPADLVTMPTGTTGAPMTYSKDGKQVIVVAVGGSDHVAEWVALGI